MILELKTIPEDLQEKIKETVKSRQSLEMLLQEEGFEGTEESIEELMRLLLKIMGSRMMLEFIYSAHIAVWDEYRKLINEEMWNRIAKEGNFNSENYLLLSTSLYHKEENELAKKFLDKAIETAIDVAEFTNIANSIHSIVKDNKEAERILIIAKSKVNSLDDLLKIASSLITITNDFEEAKKVYQDAIEMATVSHHYIEIATAILKNLHDKEWAEEVYNKKESVSESGTPIEMLATEEYKETLKNTK